MPRYVALLRGINVGGHVVKMDRLCALFESLKLARVKSVIASGNVLFDSRSTDTVALERRIERALREELGYAVDTFLRTGDELDAVVAHDPFDAGDPLLASHRMHVVFVRAPLDAATRARIEALRTTYDDLFVRGREVYWRTRGNFSDSLLKPGALDRAFGGGSGTARNINTVRKLAEKIRG